MLNLLWLIYVPTVVYLGFEVFPWWTPLIAGIGGMVVYCLLPQARYTMGLLLYGYHTEHKTVGQAIISIFNGQNPRALAGFSQLFLSMYVMYATLAFVLFGIGWGLSFIL